MITLIILLSIAAISLTTQAFKIRFNKRKFFYFDSGKHITIEVAGFSSTPAIKFAIDGSEREVTFHIGFFIGIYITFQRFIKDSWYPTEYHDGYGYLSADREIYIRFHDGSLWWSIWRDPHSWKSNDRLNSNINFGRLIAGKHTMSKNPDETLTMLLPFEEGNYKVSVVKYSRIDQWKRWGIKKRMVTYEVTPEFPVPHQGKGENSWDCGEDGTFSSSFPESWMVHSGFKIRNCYDAALNFWVSNMKDRKRYGHVNWIPKKINEADLKIITENIISD
jgi:hypothetical protein